MSSSELFKTIDHYTYSCAHKIGKGFSSYVYRGLDTVTRREVAIKVIDLQKLEKKAAQELLYSEIRIIKKLEHPHILKCENAFISANNCYIITQLCRDGDLASVLRKNGRLRGMEALNIMFQLASAYAYLASEKVIHRDIKPANILLSGSSAKIADFGFARNGGGVIRESFSVGSPLYMSPEALSSNEYSWMSDVWALGIVFYQILQGRPPFNPMSEKELREIFAQRPEILFRVAVREELQEMIKKCLAYDKQKRISPQEIVVTLEAIMCEMKDGQVEAAYRETLTRRPSQGILHRNSFKQLCGLRKEISVPVLCSTTRQNTSYGALPRVAEFSPERPLRIKKTQVQTQNQNQNQAQTHPNPQGQNFHPSQIIRCEQTPTKKLTIQEASRHNHKILKSLINFTRYIYKLFPSIRKIKASESQIERIEATALSTLKFMITLLSQSLSKTQPKTDDLRVSPHEIGILMFREFATTRCYVKTAQVVAEYLQRYTVFFDKKSRQWVTGPPLHPISSLSGLMEASQQISHSIAALVLTDSDAPELDHFTCLSQLSELTEQMKVLSRRGAKEFAQISDIDAKIEQISLPIDNQAISQLKQKLNAVPTRGA